MQNQSPINLSTLQMLKDNLGEILPELKTAFLEDGFELLEKMKKALEAKEYEAVYTAAHTLKSSAKNIGADNLADYCVQLEDNYETAPETLISIYEQASVEMANVQQFLENDN